MKQPPQTNYVSNKSWMILIILVAIFYQSAIVQTIIIYPQSHQLATQNCTSRFARLFYTKQQDKMIIKFNTNDPCTLSYVTIIQGYSISKFYCNSSLLKIQQNTVFIRYMQNCLVTIKTQEPQFKYSVYGQSNIIIDKHEDKKIVQDVITYKVNIPNAQQNFNLIVTADWGPMKVRKYQPIYPSLVRQVNNNSRPIHGMFLLGDLAYDFFTNQCQQYQIYMGQLQVVSPYLPIITLYGNHQYNNKYNIQIFKQTFEVYNLSTSARVQSYFFWNLKIVTYNPFLQIYSKSTQQAYALMKTALLQEIKPNQQNNYFTILSSHYPLICTQIDDHCTKTLEKLSDLLMQISNFNEVDLYLGAHMHQYQRIAPFKNGSFSVGEQGPYGKGRMVSIVEGVAGNDIGIIDSQFQVRNFSLSHSYNKTGYGLLTISNISKTPTTLYIHYITPSINETLIYDQVKIDISKKRDQLSDQ